MKSSGGCCVTRANPSAHGWMKPACIYAHMHGNMHIYTRQLLSRRATKPFNGHKAVERLIFHLIQPRRGRCWGRKQKEKAHIKPHEIIIKRSEPVINAFQWHIMIDSVCRRNLFPAGLWPLDQPYIIHINIDSCASQRQHTCHICTCRFNLALTLRDMPLAPTPPPPPPPSPPPPPPLSSPF